MIYVRCNRGSARGLSLKDSTVKNCFACYTSVDVENNYYVTLVLSFFSVEVMDSSS